MNQPQWVIVLLLLAGIVYLLVSPLDTSSPLDTTSPGNTSVDKYFSIYINEATLSFSTGTGHTLQEASEIAKESCGTDCRRAGYSQNACVALALAKESRDSCWGSMWGISTREAEEKALKICHSHGCECVVSISECYY